jgi:DNA-binding FrmR family transcriptional regulator
MKETGVLTSSRKEAPHVHGAADTGRKGPGPANEDALRRLRNIEGQVRGLQKMVEEEKYCVDILTQVSAVRAALNQVGMMVLKRHVEHCVVDAVKSPDAAAGAHLIDELMTVIGKGGL